MFCCFVNSFNNSWASNSENSPRNQSQGNHNKEVSNQIFEARKSTPKRKFSTDASMPEKINTTNNLWQKTGSFYGAFGEPLYIQGTIIDTFGVPIEGAIIDIWQTNSAGEYQNLLEKNSELIDKNFNMSGRALTDNLGNYYFVTIFPGSYLGNAPNINFNIYHPKFGKLETIMYFENHPKNRFDNQYLSYSLADRKMITAKMSLLDVANPKSPKIASFNIVLNGVQQYKSF